MFFFFDFRFCFDLLCFDVIWQKLHTEGLSGKMIRIIRALYKLAKCRIRVNCDYTEEIRKTKGILQGDSLSPLIFILVVADINTFLKNKGFEGIQINSNTEIILLMYADDLVIFSHSKIDLQKKINAVQEYCQINKLEVNTQKTKIIIFRKKGKLPKNDKFFYSGAPIEVVKSFTYLRVVFSSSGLFRNHMEQALTKTKIALANVKHIMVAAKMESWKDRMQLYESVVKVTLLYAAEVWALRYVEEIEKGQVQFFKNILCLFNNTPNHYIRLETGTVKLVGSVLKMTLKWVAKIQHLQESRLTKLCYARLTKLDSAISNRKDFNWLSQVKDLVQKYNEGENSINLENIERNIESLTTSCEEILHKEDLDRLSASAFNFYYKKLKTQTRQVEKYLTYKVPIDRPRILCHLRTAGDTICIYTQGAKHKWKTNEMCTLCNLEKNESVEHVLLECPHYTELRKNFLARINLATDIEITEKLIILLDINSPEKLNQTYFFIKSVLKRRKFLRNE